PKIAHLALDIAHLKQFVSSEPRPDSHPHHRDDARTQTPRSGRPAADGRIVGDLPLGKKPPGAKPGQCDAGTGASQPCIRVQGLPPCRALAQICARGRIAHLRTSMMKRFSRATASAITCVLLAL